MRRDRSKAIKAVEPFDGKSDGYGDAIRHCYWRALNQRAAGLNSPFAKELGEAHEDVIWSLPYKMSKELRQEISYTLDDTFMRVLFINNYTIEAYTEIGKGAACFSKSEITNRVPIFPYNQRFVLD